MSPTTTPPTVKKKTFVQPFLHSGAHSKCNDLLLVTSASILCLKSLDYMDRTRKNLDSVDCWGEGGGGMLPPSTSEINEINWGECFFAPPKKNKKKTPLPMPMVLEQKIKWE